MQVFICYSRSDKQFAAQLAEDLSEYELTVWMDVRSIPTGANWDAEVQKGLDHSDVLLVLLSPAASASQNVADEWSYFIEHNKTIVPLLIVPGEVPFRLSRRQRVDFTGDYRAGFQQLIKALGSPPLRDPDSTQRMHPVTTGAPANTPVAPAPTSAPAKQAAPISPPTGPQVTTKTYPVIWSESYNWFNGMGGRAVQGEVIINPRELKFVPSAKPILTIPLKSVVSATVQRSVDRHLKLTYYGKDGSFQSLVLMGAEKDNRRQTNEEILNLLKLITGRALT